MNDDKRWTMPVVRVTLESMRQQMLHAWSTQLEDMTAGVERALAEALNERSIHAEMKQLATQTLDREIRELVERKVHEVIWDKEFQDAFLGAVKKAVSKVEFVK